MIDRKSGVPALSGNGQHAAVPPAPGAAVRKTPGAAMEQLEPFRLKDYLKSNSLIVGLVTLGCVLLAAMEAVLGISLAGCVLTLGLVLTIALISFLYDYLRKRAYYDELAQVGNAVTQSSLMAALSHSPRFVEGERTQEALERAVHLANDELQTARVDASDYRQYVELWVHEAKTPVAALRLMVNGLHGEEAQKLSVEIERVESLVEQALYYARSTSLAGDYRIRQVSLPQACREACKKNMHLLLEHDVVPVFDLDEDVTVAADEMWLIFILGQIIANAAKYGASTVTFTSWEEEPDTPRAHCVLQIADDGRGIPATDIHRVFERGYTGENGHAQGRATGMGLYLVAELCQRMGLGVGLGSEEGQGTRVCLSFPHDRRRADLESVYRQA